MTNRCRDAKVRVFVELESAAVDALLNRRDYEPLQDWGSWELPHNALGPMRLARDGGPDPGQHGMPVHRIEMRCEQAEALRDRSTELAKVLETMPDEHERADGAALHRAARALDEAIRTPLPPE